MNYLAINLWYQSVNSTSYAALVRREAKADKAPFDTVYKSGDRWVTIGEVWNKSVLNDMLRRLEEYYAPALSSPSVNVIREALQHRIDTLEAHETDVMMGEQLAGQLVLAEMRRLTKALKEDTEIAAEQHLNALNAAYPKIADYLAKDTDARIRAGERV